MLPFETWKKNKWKSNIRKYTLEFEKKFKSKFSLTEVGKMYAVTYKVDSSVPTDKFHLTPVMLSFGRFHDEDGAKYVRGLNLLFLNTRELLQVLEDFYPFMNNAPDSRVQPILKLHEKYMKKFPYVFKNFAERKIVSVNEVDVEEWGMVPLLHKYLWGTFNAIALDEAFQAENKARRKTAVNKRKKKLHEHAQVSEDVLEEDSVSDEIEIEIEDYYAHTNV